MWKNKTTDNSN